MPKVSAEESDLDFATRPRASRIGPGSRVKPPSRIQIELDARVAKAGSSHALGHILAHPTGAATALFRTASNSLEGAPVPPALASNRRKARAKGGGGRDFIRDQVVALTRVAGAATTAERVKESLPFSPRRESLGRMKLVDGLMVLGVLAGGRLWDSEGGTHWKAVLGLHGIDDERIGQAMEKVHRADFLPESQRPFELEDRPLPIGFSQTTSQPSLIALMIRELGLTPHSHVLEVGTGSGYQTALLAELCEEVSSIEIVEPLAKRAAERLASLGYRNVKVRAGDGYLGWPERAPFDAIIVSAGAAKLPSPLVEQLRPGGRLVIPLEGDGEMQLTVVQKAIDGKLSTRRVVACASCP